MTVVIRLVCPEAPFCSLAMFKGSKPSDGLLRTSGAMPTSIIFMQCWWSKSLRIHQDWRASHGGQFAEDPLQLESSLQQHVLPLANCPASCSHSQPWRQLMIVFWCFCWPIAVLTSWQPKHTFVISFFPVHFFRSIKHAHSSFHKNRGMLLSPSGALGNGATGNS